MDYQQTTGEKVKPTLDELFSRDPEKCDEADIEQLVAYFRENRHKFHLEEKKKAVKKGQAELSNVDIDNIFSQSFGGSDDAT